MRFFNREIPLGDAGIAVTVQHMQRLTARDARDPATKWIGDQLAQARFAREAFWYTVRAIPYVTDPGRVVCIENQCTKLPKDAEFLIRPAYTLSRRIVGGDCDDMSMAVAALLRRQGIKCWFKTIAWRCPEFTHVYVVAEIDGRMMPLDPVAGDDGFGWERPDIRRSRLHLVP